MKNTYDQNILTLWGLDKGFNGNKIKIIKWR